MDAPVSRARNVSTYCYQCVAGPDLLTVRVEDGTATEIGPNFTAAEIHPAGGKVCVKAFGLVQKAYNPHRVLHPMKRTNPNKGRNEDPGFVRISWDEALDLVAAKLNKVRAVGLLDEAGFPRVAASFGGGGTPTAYMGTLPALLAAWGSVDMSFGSGQGVKCYHSEHLYGELWHRAFTVSPDTPLCEYLVSFGANVEASGGVCGVKRHADARARGMKRVQIEPHLSVTGACSAEWIPIKPKTDVAFLFAMLHVVLHEHRRERLDLPFLKHRSSSPYLIGPGGFFLRDPHSRKPLIFDLRSARAVPFDAADTDPALEGCFLVDGIEVGADHETTRHEGVRVTPAFAHLVDHVKNYTPCGGRAASAMSRPPRSGESPPSSSTTPASAPRSRSTARRCRCARYRSRSARRSITAGAATSAAGRARCSPVWSAPSRCRAARSAPRCGSIAPPTTAGRA